MSALETEFPRQLKFTGLDVRVEISDANLQTLLSTWDDQGKGISITLDLRELDDIVGVLQAARTELRAIRKDREDKSVAARDFVMRCGGVDAARDALIAVAAAESAGGAT